MDRYELFPHTNKSFKPITKNDLKGVIGFMLEWPKQMDVDRGLDLLDGRKSMTPEEKDYLKAAVRLHNITHFGIDFPKEPEPVPVPVRIGGEPGVIIDEGLDNFFLDVVRVGGVDNVRGRFEVFDGVVDGRIQEGE